MLNLTKSCFKCPEGTCLECKGNEAARKRISTLLTLKKMIIYKGSKDMIDLDSGIARLKNIELKLHALRG